MVFSFCFDTAVENSFESCAAVLSAIGFLDFHPGGGRMPTTICKFLGNGLSGRNGVPVGLNLIIIPPFCGAKDVRWGLGRTRLLDVGQSATHNASHALLIYSD